MKADGLPQDEAGLRQLENDGLYRCPSGDILTGFTEADIRRARLAQGVTAVFKRIDTCAAEFEAQTPYMYSTYEAPMMGEVECEARPSDAKRWSFWAVAQTASVRGSSLITAAVTPASP